MSPERNHRSPPWGSFFLATIQYRTLTNCDLSVAGKPLSNINYNDKDK
jgi:hypothetical protein